MRIDNAKLKSGEDLQFGDFNVFVGGNGVGKTTIVSEVFDKISAANGSKYLWIDQLSHSANDVTADLKLLKKSLAHQREGASLFYLSSATKGIGGNIDLDGSLRFSEGEVAQMESVTDASIFNTPKYRRPFITFSSCESRLTFPDGAGLTGLDQPPSDALNVLFRDGGLMEDISDHIHRRFGYYLVLIDHTFTALKVGISHTKPPDFDRNARDKQSASDKVRKWEEEHLIPITKAGHGIRSMVKLLTALLEPVNQIIIIDEPELHLYPSQKRWFGYQLALLASTQNKQIFLVTHDASILQGIFEGSANTHLFRVNKDNHGVGTVRSCQLPKQSISHSKNQHQYLQGLFYQRCVVVEGSSDRLFYETLFNDYPKVQDKDLGFIACSGTGNAKNVASMVAQIGLKASFIFDLDVLVDKRDLIQEVYETLGGEGHPLQRLETILMSNPSVRAAPINKKNAAIKKLTGYTKKNGFSTQWMAANRRVVMGCLNKLESVGIFIVPRGDLESWAPQVRNKIDFAELAPDIIRQNILLDKELKVFAKKVLKWIDINIGRKT
ncbi:MAG: AAA family ATPase [Patescibacteria group bacterium]